MMMTARAVRTIEEYLRQLREELRGEDEVLVQEALALCEDYLRAEVAARWDTPPGDVLELICSTYGAPEDVAAAYRPELHSELQS